MVVCIYRVKSLCGAVQGRIAFGFLQKADVIVGELAVDGGGSR